MQEETRESTHRRHGGIPDRLVSWWRRTWRGHLGTLALVAVVYFGAQAWQTRGVPDRLPSDTQVEVLRGDGSTHVMSLADAVALVRTAFPDQPVALHLWAEWCPICRAEQGSITHLGQDWPVLTVAMQSGAAAAVHQVQRQRRLPWVTLVDPQGGLTHALGYTSVPGFVVVDARNRLREPTSGFTTETGMRLRLWWARTF
ncbi:MAG: redoxin family protein [Burkholderiaceae bacterium]